MSARIPCAIQDNRMVYLDQVNRGQSRLTCYTCEDKIVVKQGKSRRKHFSHTGNSKCHGEGPAHYRLKRALRDILLSAIEIQGKPDSQSIFISYPCPEPEYALRCGMKFGPPILEGESVIGEFEELKAGFHSKNLTENLREVRCEVWLNNRKTRADVAGFDRNGNLLWAIEIKRYSLSNAAIDSAKDTGIPLFVIDISEVPKSPEDNPYAEDEALWIVWENLRNGFLPRASRDSINVVCDRKESGAGPEDNCAQSFWGIYGDGSKVLLHRCSDEICRDWQYIFSNDIDQFEMYMNPIHSVNSHSPADVPADVHDRVISMASSHFTQATR